MGMTTLREPSMRDWLLMALPIVFVIYFLIYPDQFNELVTLT